MLCIIGKFEANLDKIHFEKLNKSFFKYTVYLHTRGPQFMVWLMQGHSTSINIYKIPAILSGDALCLIVTCKTCGHYRSTIQILA